MRARPSATPAASTQASGTPQARGAQQLAPKRPRSHHHLSSGSSLGTFPLPADEVFFRERREAGGRATAGGVAYRDHHEIGGGELHRSGGAHGLMVTQDWHPGELRGPSVRRTSQHLPPRDTGAPGRLHGAPPYLPSTSTNMMSHLGGEPGRQAGASQAQPWPWGQHAPPQVCPHLPLV